MEDITMEKKLRMVQQIRSQYNKNQYDLSNREQILYGRSANKISMDSIEPLQEKVPFEEKTPSSFRIRAALAGVLLLTVILFDRMGIQPAGVQMNEIFQVIATDYQENVDALVNAITDSQVPW